MKYKKFKVYLESPEYEAKELLDLFKKEEIGSLKTKIIQLEEENKKLLLQLEKRDEKVKRTVAVKQDADRELNECRQKIFSLESEIQNLKKETTGELSFRFSESLSKKRLEDLLFFLGSVQSKSSTLITIYLAKDGTLMDIDRDITDRILNSERALIEKIESQTGKVIFYDTDRIIKLMIIPVFPVLKSENSLDRGFNTGQFEIGLESERTLIINAHAGMTFIGIIEADTFVEHEVVKSSVMGKHSKGGWSQKRFQSLVEEDIKHHADKVRAALEPVIEKNRDIKYVIAGGDGKLIRMIMEGYDYPLIMKSMDARASDPQHLLKEAMSVRVYGI